MKDARRPTTRREEVEQHCEIRPSLAGRDVGHVTRPDEVRRDRIEVASTTFGAIGLA